MYQVSKNKPRRRIDEIYRPLEQNKKAARWTTNSLKRITSEVLGVSNAKALKILVTAQFAKDLFGIYAMATGKTRMSTKSTYELVINPNLEYNLIELIEGPIDIVLYIGYQNWSSSLNVAKSKIKNLINMEFNDYNQYVVDSWEEKYSFLKSDMKFETDFDEFSENRDQYSFKSNILWKEPSTSHKSSRMGRNERSYYDYDRMERDVMERDHMDHDRDAAADERSRTS